MSKTYTLPATFYFDHADRDLPAGEVVKVTKRGVIVNLDHEAYQDLLSDANYYVEVGPDMGREYFGLVSSARATVRALLKQGEVNAA